MVDAKSVHTQLRRLKFDTRGWGRAEINELPNILSPDEKIYECVNGIYDGGFALLVATSVRVLLIDKKPLNFLTVEDLRFDMINQIDYNHRLMGASITISTGYKTLKFTSYNKPRLRKLINHVQDRMSEIKKEENEHQENQKQHLAAINQQLQAYLLAQHQQFLQLQQQQTQGAPAPFQPVKPSPELSDYLFAQSLMQQFGNKADDMQKEKPVEAEQEKAPLLAAAEPRPAHADSTNDLYDEGYREIFGKRLQDVPAVKQEVASFPGYWQDALKDNGLAAPLQTKNLEVNPLRIAYSKLPMMLRNRKFGRPSFHAHSQSAPSATIQPQTATQ
ncbi:MAG TPA: PH domain-containing protein [Candidatus Saccharimonadales bacterium]|nr:PH domain-containing protein [Candidatus Saccharimonadales bacterium]